MTLSIYIFYNRNPFNKFYEEIEQNGDNNFDHDLFLFWEKHNFA